MNLDLEKRGALANFYGNQAIEAKPINPQEIFCLNIECHARGQTGKDNINAMVFD